MKKSDLEKENKYLKEKVKFLEKYMFDLLKEVQTHRQGSDSYPWGIGGPSIHVPWSSPSIQPSPGLVGCGHFTIVNGYCTSCGACTGSGLTSSGTSPFSITTSGDNTMTWKTGK